MAKEIFKDYLLSTIRMYLHYRRMDLTKEDQLGLVIIDNFNGHKFEDDELAEIEQRLKAKICYLPAYYSTSMIQPLDLTINYIIKTKLRNLWLGWHLKSTKTSDNNSKAPAPTKQNVYDWFGSAWNSVSPLTMIKFLPLCWPL